MSQHRNTTLQQLFALRLKTARGNLSQAEFARFLGIKHQQTYQRYEGGQIPSGDILHQIAFRLGVKLDDLLPTEHASGAGNMGERTALFQMGDLSNDQLMECVNFLSGERKRAPEAFQRFVVPLFELLAKEIGDRARGETKEKRK